MPSREETLLKHYRDFFVGHNSELLSWNTGPIVEVIPEFKVFLAKPGPKHNLWSYCSIGASTVQRENTGLLEFVVHSPVETPRLVKILAMVAYYHNNHGLGLGHTLPIGEPWLDNSACDHWLLSNPYPLGPEFEICNLEKAHIHVAWLLPITEQERNYKASNGLEALEKLFEEKGLEYWNVTRTSVV